jgi:PhzF family phenazine biosynthesis protein
MQLIRVFPAPGSANGESEGGNPAPVWLAADALGTASMQQRTRLDGHESVFVLKPADADAHRWRFRFFVPRHEMEMCGHATIGALWLLHDCGEWDGAPVAIETLSGTVHGRRVEGRVEISQPRATVQVVDDAALIDRIAQCLRIEARDIVGPVLNSSTSRVKTLIRVTSAEALHALRPDFAIVEALCEALGSTGLYPFAAVQDAAPTFSARQFPKSSGYPEDAATGIAAAALAWGARHLGLVDTDPALITVRQGEAMGSPSAIFVRLPARRDESNGCWLSGDAREIDQKTSPADLRLAALPGATDTPRAKPAGHYASFATIEHAMHSSGVVGRDGGKVVAGPLRGADDVARGAHAATAAVIAILRAAQDELGSLSRVAGVVALNGYLATSSEFTQHVAVMDAASSAIRHVFPDAPLPARTTVGVASLPGGGAAEVSMVIALRDDD